MVVKKEDFITSDYLTKEQGEEFKKLCGIIDSVLTEDYIGGKTMTIDIDVYPHERVVKMIEDTYTKAGWDIIFHLNQSDGNYITIS